MKLTRILAVVVLVALILTACSQEENSDKDIINPFIGGSQGLKISVLDGAPPPTVTDSGSQRFAITLAIENVGESTVGEGENPFIVTRLSGISPQNFGTIKENLTKEVDQSLMGARKNVDGTILPGETTSVSFQPLNYQNSVPGSQVFRFRANVCYDYSTHATMKVCVKDNVLENVQDNSLCTLRRDLNPLNSGGPLHVVKADQNPVGDNRIQVNFEVANVGDGVFFNRRSDNPRKACSFNVRNKNMYEALIVAHPVDPKNYDLDCTGLKDEKPGFKDLSFSEESEYGVVDFGRNSPRSLTCFLEKTTDIGGRVFQDVMEIDMYYRYGEFLEIPILVQDAQIADMGKTPKGWGGVPKAGDFNPESSSGGSQPGNE